VRCDGGLSTLAKCGWQHDSKADWQNFLCTRLEMSLRTKERATPTAAMSLAEIAVGSVVEGSVRRVEDFGVFVEVTTAGLSTASSEVLCGKLVFSEGASLLYTIHCCQSSASCCSC
jgi:RecJ-like exonuclease